MINSGSAGPMLLGTFDEAKEIMRVDQKLGPQGLDASGTLSPHLPQLLARSLCQESKRPPLPKPLRAQLAC